MGKFSEMDAQFQTGIDKLIEQLSEPCWGGITKFVQVCVEGESKSEYERFCDGCKMFHDKFNERIEEEELDFKLQCVPEYKEDKKLVLITGVVCSGRQRRN